jgi:hypothetical protein
MKKIIIIIVIVVLAFIGYSFLISGNKQDSSSGVTRQNVSNTAASQANPTLDGPGKEFVSQLLAIKTIKFNLSFFQDEVFRGLQDWTREILPQESGRPNPFAPLEGDSSFGPNSISDLQSTFTTTSATATATTTRTTAPARTPAVRTR